jgi:hypothetical protein
MQLRPLLATILVAATCWAGDAVQPIGDFDLWHEDWVFGNGAEFAGAKGRAALEGGKEAKVGAGALRLDADLSSGGRYVQISRKFDGLPLTALSGWVRGDNVSALGFRIVDSTGQMFQSRKKYPLSGKWQKLAITIEELTKSEHWDGANDGVWHGPAKVIAFTLGGDALEKGTAGTVWFDGLGATLAAGSPKPTATPAKGLVLDTGEHGLNGWTFVAGEEFPGAKGGVDADKTGAKNGKACIRLDADFSGGGSYVAAHHNLADQTLDVRELRVWIKRRTAGGIRVRLIDSTGQCHQAKGGLSLNNEDAWQETLIQVPDIAGGEHWGGANDGVWHPPMKGVSFLIGKDRVGQDGKGQVWFDDLRAVVVAPAPAKR